MTDGRPDVSAFDADEQARRAYRQGRLDGLSEARDAVVAYVGETHKHVGVLKCWPENGDRCDITAAIKVVARRIDALRDQRNENRDAVAALPVESRGIGMKDDALAAIDALKEDK